MPQKSHYPYNIYVHQSAIQKHDLVRRFVRTTVHFYPDGNCVRYARINWHNAQIDQPDHPSRILYKDSRGEISAITPHSDDLADLISWLQFATFHDIVWWMYARRIK